MPDATCLRLAGKSRRLQMPLVGHLPQAVELEQAVASGQSGFEHAHHIANTRRIHAVPLGGGLHDRPQLDALLHFTRRQARSPATMARLLWGFLNSTVRDEL